MFVECPVLVHGDSGTDMTLVLTSLAQILLDPECRTIKGYESSVYFAVFGLVRFSLNFFS